MTGNQCPECRAKRDPQAIECNRCGIIFEKSHRIRPKKAGIKKEPETLIANHPNPTQIPQKTASGPIRLDCKVCGTKKAMKASKIPKFIVMPQFTGCLIAVPTVLGVIFAGLLFITTSEVSSEVMNSAHSNPEITGLSIGLSIGFYMAGFVVFGLSVSALMGRILTLKKKIYTCTHCGFVMDQN